ncbi:hypothetical protein Pcac1_g7748 [Phytophthora cactorum]|nr:hypothetical protein Pcac1_g7748 [Phytophthora cactorum]
MGYGILVKELSPARPPPPSIPSYQASTSTRYYRFRCVGSSQCRYHYGCCEYLSILHYARPDERGRSATFHGDYGQENDSAAFTLLPFGKNNATSLGDSNTIDFRPHDYWYGSSGLGNSTTTTGAQGMEKYAYFIGVDPAMLFYLTVVGIGCMDVLFGLYRYGACYFSARDFPTAGQTIAG